VEEYYEFDPDRLKLKGWIRQGGKLEAIPQMQGWVSPLTGVRFELAVGDTDRELKLYQPDGTQFKTYLELIHERREAIEAYIGEQEARKQLEQEWMREQQARIREQEAREQAEQERMREQQARIREQEAREQAEQERMREQQARIHEQEAREQAERERNEAEKRLQDLLAKLKAQNIELPE
jgi:hypothetical protein